MVKGTSRILQAWVWAGDPCQCTAVTWMSVRVILVKDDANRSAAIRNSL